MVMRLHLFAIEFARLEQFGPTFMDRLSRLSDQLGYLLECLFLALIILFDDFHPLEDI